MVGQVKGQKGGERHHGGTEYTSSVRSVVFIPLEEKAWTSPCIDPNSKKRLGDVCMGKVGRLYHWLVIDGKVDKISFAEASAP